MKQTSYHHDTASAFPIPTDTSTTAVAAAATAVVASLPPTYPPRPAHTSNAPVSPRNVCAFFTGYAFLIFQEDQSVWGLISCCTKENDKLYCRVSSPSVTDKQVRWLLVCVCACAYVFAVLFVT